MPPNTSSWRRVVTLESGKAMVVTDLHGDKDAFDRYLDLFLDLKARDAVDYLILAGDLIHHSGPAVQDRSIDMVHDVIRLQDEFGHDRILYLLGNHELPHIYGIPLQKGNDLFTPRFEKRMAQDRERIMALFDRLPFYVCTSGGVTITHAGATNAIGERDGVQRLFDFSHQGVLNAARATITDFTRPSLLRAVSRIYNQPYEKLAREYLAVSGPDDPRYDDFLIGTLATTGNEDFDLLWSALFSRNEQEYGPHVYEIVVRNMLQSLSAVGMAQKVMVTGHMDCRGGFSIVNKQQLRIASAKHAHPREAGVYLLWDTRKKIETASQLRPYLHSIFK